MGKESNIRSWVVKALRSYHAVAVENSCSPGTPDVYCTLGWIEIKQIDAWPSKDGAIVRVPHFTEAQRAWLTREMMAGRPCWFLLRVGDQYRLFRGHTAAACIGSASKESLISASTLVTRSTLCEEMK